MDFCSIDKKLAILNQAFKNQPDSKQYIYAQILEDLIKIYQEASAGRGASFIQSQKDFDAFEKSLYENNIFGLLSNKEGKTLWALAKKSKTIVEIGTFLGYSSCIMGQFAEKIYCIDCGYDDFMDFNSYIPFHMFYKTTEQTDKIPNNIPKIEICKNNWETAKVSDKIQVINKLSDDATNDVPDQIDLLWVDGLHTYDGCYNDLNNYWPKVKTGGYVAIHDMVATSSSAGVVGAVHEFYLEHKEQLSEPYMNDMIIFFERIK